MPKNQQDTTVEHPTFHTEVGTPNGGSERVTLFTYTKFKFKLYKLASPIITDIYFHRASSIRALSKKVREIDKELTVWFKSLPPELRMDKLPRKNEMVRFGTNTFTLQALALQIAYDNILILLHRPLLAYNLQEVADASPMAPSQMTNYMASADGMEDARYRTYNSQDKCWESAIRTSNLGRYRDCLVSARETHAAAFLGINLFTAGMVLCIVALSKPLSCNAQIAKQALGRIIAISRSLEDRALVASQTNKVLGDLIRMILEKEMTRMMVPSDLPASQVPHSRPAVTEVANLAAGGTPQSLRPSANHAQFGGMDAAIEGPPQVMGDAMSDHSFPEAGNGDNIDMTLFNDMDLQEGINSLQQGEFCVLILLHHLLVSSSSILTDLSHQVIFPSATSTAGELFSVSSGQGNGQSNGLVDGANAIGPLGQTWLWEPDPWRATAQGYPM